jgi:hypothetical protein
MNITGLLSLLLTSRVIEAARRVNEDVLLTVTLNSPNKIALEYSMP